MLNSGVQPLGCVFFIYGTTTCVNFSSQMISSHRRDLKRADPYAF